MKRKLFLHGKLRKLAPEFDGIELDVATVAEAIEAICQQSKGLIPIPGQGRHEIEVPGFVTKESLYEDLGDDIGEIHLVPSLRGGKSGGVFQIIIGVVIMVISIASLVYGNPTGLQTAMLAMSLISGTMMTVQGVMQLVSPSPKAESSPAGSTYIGIPKNTAAIGTPVPILYGRMLCYGQILSMEISATDWAYGQLYAANPGPVTYTGSP
jgi:predicted phage tail protein